MVGESVELDAASRRRAYSEVERGFPISLQGAIADVPDPPAQLQSTAPPPVASLAEQSRWPGSEARLDMPGAMISLAYALGVGGYFSPHKYNEYFSFDAWAATIDYRFPLFARLDQAGVSIADRPSGD